MGYGATWYYLWVDGPSGHLLKKWYDAAEVCGASTCSVTLDTELTSGAHVWWIRTWNELGYGPWSGARNFTLNP